MQLQNHQHTGEWKLTQRDKQMENNMGAWGCIERASEKAVRLPQLLTAGSLAKVRSVGFGDRGSSVQVEERAAPYSSALKLSARGNFSSESYTAQPWS